MSITSPLPTPQPPKLAPQTPVASSWRRAEWRYLSTMPPVRGSILLIIWGVLLFLTPALPLAAYLLQRWAANSWQWRDRWASIWTWAKYGIGVVLGGCGVLLLAQDHVWVFPALVAIAHAWWQRVHLPGTFAVFPWVRHTILARTLLFLPLAPTLALLNEWLLPRTRVSLQRVLTPTDWATSAPVSPPAERSAQPPETATSATKTRSKAARKTTKRQRDTTQPPETVESTLVGPALRKKPRSRKVDKCGTVFV